MTSQTSDTVQWSSRSSEEDKQTLNDWKSSTPALEKKIHSGEIAIDSFVTHLVKSLYIRDGYYLLFFLALLAHKPPNTSAFLYQTGFQWK